MAQGTNLISDCKRAPCLKTPMAYQAVQQCQEPLGLLDYDNEILYLVGSL